MNTKQLGFTRNILQGVLIAVGVALIELGIIGLFALSACAADYRERYRPPQA
jgi:hypothetical protein